MRVTYTGSVADTLVVGSVTVTGVSTGNAAVTSEVTSLFGKADETFFGNVGLLCAFKHEGTLTNQNDIDYRAYLGVKYGTTIFA